MTPEPYLSFATAIICLGLGAFVLARDRGAVTWVFAGGMAAWAAERALTGIETTAPAGDLLSWERGRLLAKAASAGLWLLFSATFARGDLKARLRGAKPWTVAAGILLPLSLGLLAATGAYETVVEGDDGGRLLLLSRSGHAFYLLYLLTAVVILVNLETTLRASIGTMRWRAKFTALGIGAPFAVGIYTSSQAILFRAQVTALHTVEAGAVLVGAILVAVSLVRGRLTELEVFPSGSVLFGSLAVSFTGAYLLVLGFVAKFVADAAGQSAVPIAGFVIFVGLLGLATILLSDHLRHGARQLISRHFRRPLYDYRKEWLGFTRQTSSLTDIETLGPAVAKVISGTLGVPSVSLWLFDDRGGVVLGGSTVFTENQARGFQLGEQTAASLATVLRNYTEVVDLQGLPAGWPDDLNAGTLDFFREARYCIPLSAGGENLGFLTLSVRGSGDPLTLEAVDLLKTLADQAAASLLNLRLSERLVHAREMEAFQTLSAFFIHDLKNLASRLSLTMQNLPAHYDDPDFRSDLLAVISRSVEKIDQMCSRLSPLSRTLELRREQTDLRELVAVTLAGLDGALRGSVVQDLQAVPPLALDGEQIQKVLVNLVLNANEAIGDGGTIRLATGRRGEWAIVSVSDTGCGMSKDFVARSLFQPFRSTKSKGLGIGLYHSRKIVEAHEGRIEVESEEGRGSTFRVVLPLA